MKFADLRVNHITKYSADKSKSLSSGTPIKHHSLIRDCLSHAVKWDLIMRTVERPTPINRPAFSTDTVSFSGSCIFINLITCYYCRLGTVLYNSAQ